MEQLKALLSTKLLKQLSSLVFFSKCGAYGAGKLVSYRTTTLECHLAVRQHNCTRTFLIVKNMRNSNLLMTLACYQN